MGICCIGSKILWLWIQSWRGTYTPIKVFYWHNWTIKSHHWLCSQWPASSETLKKKTTSRTASLLGKKIQGKHLANVCWMKANGWESDTGGWLLPEACKAWVCFALHLDFGSIYSDSFAHELRLLSWLYCGIQCWFPSPLHDQTFSSGFFISELWEHLLLTFTYFFNTIPHQTRSF